jgi:hypothetical protein
LNDEPHGFPMDRPMARSEPRSPRTAALLAAGAIACAALGLGACSIERTVLGPLQYDKASPAAGAIASTSVRQQPYPSFLDVPSQPDDVRPISAWNRNIFDTLAQRRVNEAYQVANPQSLYGAEAFAQEGQAQAAPPITADQAQALADQSKAFAKEGQARAKPPSPAP